MLSPLIEKLIKALTCLPGVGPKSAQRMTFQLLERNREGAMLLASTLVEAMRNIKRCDSCRTFAELSLCNICSDKGRDNSTICVVETPADVVAIEQSRSYKGLYFVLMGHLSPIDGIGPNELGIPEFISRLQQDDAKELILATNATVEGEATAFYLAEAAKQFNITTTRIAHGVPMGGELEHIDGGTLSRALDARTPI